jgi:hypothetical protein
MPTTKKLRDEAKYRILPPLDAETYAGLRANIPLNGIQVPVVKDEKGYILDSFARARIAEERAAQGDPGLPGDRLQRQGARQGEG